MRKIIIGLLVLLAACNSTVDPDRQLLDSWQWVSSSGGIAGVIQTPASTGDQVVIEFSDKTYEKYVNGSLDEDLGYRVKMEESIFSTDLEEIITYSNGWRQSYMIRGDTLFLSDECYDCFGHVYVRN